PAALARLPAAAVDLELVLHRTALAVREPVVAQGGALPVEPPPESLAHCAVKRLHLVWPQLGRRPQRVQAGTPERPLRLDVSPPLRERAWGGRRRLHGRPPRYQLRGEVARAIAGGQRFGPDARVEIRLDRVRLEQQPRAEAPDVAIRDLGPVVQREHGAGVRI